MPLRAAFGGGLRPALTACEPMPRSAAVDRRIKLRHGLPPLSLPASRTAALSRTRSLRITATMITLPGLPRARRRSQNALISGSQRMAVRAGLNRITFTAQRPRTRPRRRSERPLLSTRDAKPPDDAISRRSSLAVSGNSAKQRSRGRLCHPFALAHHLLLERELQVVGLMARELSLNGDQTRPQAARSYARSRRAPAQSRRSRADTARHAAPP